MMRGALLRAVVLVAGLHAMQAGAQVLWGGTGYGMSPAQVLAQVPQAQVPDDPDELAGGESEGLRLAEAPLAGHAFRGSFFFAWDELHQVNLSLQAPREGRADLRVFEDVARELEAAHGAPVASEWLHEPYERQRQEWSAAGTRIVLLLSQAGTESLVKVVYQVRPPDAPPPVELHMQE